MRHSVIEEFEKQGYQVQGTKILAASPRRVQRFHALGLNFVAIRDDKGKIIKRGWTAVTKQQAVRLKDVIDPVTEEPYLRFAYVPIPAEVLQKKDKTVDKVELSELNGDKSGIVDADDFEDQEVKVRKSSEDEEYEDEFDKIKEDQEEKLAAGESEEVAVKTEEVKDLESKSDSVTPGQVERAELKDKSLSELKKIVSEDLGLELPKNVSKEELIEMIAG